MLPLPKSSDFSSFVKKPIVSFWLMPLISFSNLKSRFESLRPPAGIMLSVSRFWFCEAIKLFSIKVHVKYLGHRGTNLGPMITLPQVKIIHHLDHDSFVISEPNESWEAEAQPWVPCLPQRIRPTSMSFRQSETISPNFPDLVGLKPNIRLDTLRSPV